MTHADQRAYVKRWVETAHLLGELRWRELRTLVNAVALAASDQLIDAALRVPMPQARRAWSGLVAQQALFHRLADR